MTAAADFDPASLDGLDRGIVGIDGLWCPSCAAAVGRAMSAVPGITRAQVSFAGASAAIAWEKGTDLAAMARKVSAMGYRLTAPDLGDGMEERIVGEMRRVAIRLAVSVVFGMWTMLLSILLYINPDGIADGATGRAFALAAGAMAVPVVAWAGAPILLAGWRTARVGVPGMDTLVSLGVAGAVAASVWSLATARSEVWFDTAVMLVTLLTLGRLIEMATLRQSSRSIAALRTALPETARRIGEDGKAEEVLASEVRTGERIRVAAGERVSLDGLLSSGESRFDTSVLTGESVPRSIGQGEEVQAGFINLSRMVEIAVTAEMGARRIDRMGVDIATALHARPEIHRLADRLARVIVPLALSLALVTLLVGLATGMAGAAAGLRALSVLIIACPCAVAIAAPVSHLAATGAAAVRGIHFRTQAASESLGAVERVLFDKTGTLTEGRPVLRELHLQPGLSRARALALAAAAEHEVVHPVARALRESGGQGLLASTSERFSDGVAATIDGVDALIGSRGFLLRHGIAPPETQAQDAGLTAVYLAADGNWAATYLLGDALRPDAAATLSQLRSEGLALGMASGDAEAPCAFVGAEAGLAPDEIHAACTPEQKAELVAGGKAASTAFVGDGVNDMLAIVRADVGIAATDASPSTIALADVVIANGGMSAVAEAIDISRKARRVLRQNLVFSVGYNAVALTLAVFGTVPPLAAAVAMAASSIMVIGNAARLRAGVYTRSAQPGSSLSASA